MERQEVGSGQEDEEGPLDVDSQLSCKRYFTERVEFAPAHYPDTHLKEKHLPINALNEKMESSSLSSPPPPPPPPVIQSEIPKPKKVLFDPGCLQMKWAESRSIGSGLGNMGNTCFLNSVLQCLSYTPPLVNFMLSGEHKNNCVHQGFCAMCEFHCHLVRIRKSMGVVKPLPIVHNLRVFAKHFRNGHQEDAHEFLRYFIDSLQKISLIGHQPSKLDVYSKHTTVIHQIFGGYHRSQVKCLKCKRTSDTYDPLLDISLDIKGCPSLLKALQSSIKPDLLDEENKYACPFCKELTRAKKQLTIHTLPNVLTIQLKRFEFNTLFGGKINKIVQYPEYLNMRPFMSDKEGPAEWYRLYAVLVHYGYSCHSGHYYCYVKNSNGIWYSMNDSLVSQVSLNTVLTQQAYLLFYIKDPEYVRNTSLPSSPTVSPFTPKKQASNVSAIGVPVKRSNNEQAPPTPSKPTGVVTPSPKCTVTPPPASPLPVPPHSNDTKSFITGKKNSFDLFKSQSTPSNKPLQLMKPKTPTTPTFQTPDMASSKCSVPATPSSLTTPPTAPVTTPFTNFTPRAVAMSKSKFSAAEEPNKPKKPQARVPPMRSKPNTKPVARVKPSPQQVDQPTTETSSTINIVKDRTEDTVTSNNDLIASPNSKDNINKEDPKSKEKEDTNSKDDEVVKTQCDSSKQEWTVSDSLPPPSSPVKFGPPLPPDSAQSSSPNWVVSDLKEHQPPLDKKPKKSKKHSVKRDTLEDSSSKSSDTDEELVVKEKGKESKRKDKEIKRNKREDREREKERGKNKGKEKTKEKDDRDHLKSSRDYTKNREDKERVKERDHRDKERDHSKKRLKDKNRDRKNKEREDRDQRKQSKSKRHRERSSSSEDDENEFQRKRKKSTEHSKKKHKRHHNKSSRHHPYYSESSDDEEEDDGRRHKRQRSPPPLRPHHTHSKPWDNDRNRRGDRDKHRQAQRGIEELRRRRETDKTFDELVKPKGSGSVTEIKWDSTTTRRSYDHNIHHRGHHDHDSSSPGNVLDSLDKSDQLGSKVKRWDGEKNSIDSSQQQTDSRRRRGRDDWDREIDKGKIKKSKIKHDDDESWGSKNKFQSYQNKRNLNKF